MIKVRGIGFAEAVEEVLGGKNSFGTSVGVARSPPARSDAGAAVGTSVDVSKRWKFCPLKLVVIFQ